MVQLTEPPCTCTGDMKPGTVPNLKLVNLTSQKFSSRRMNKTVGMASFAG